MSENTRTAVQIGQQLDHLVVQNELEIDDFLLAIATYDKTIADYEALKAKRVQPIDDEIRKLETHKTEYRRAILEFMAKNEEKSLNYPGVAKINRKKGQAKWVVVDDLKLINYLMTVWSDAQLQERGIIKVEPKLVKKELNKALDELACLGGSLPEDAVVSEPPADVLSITFDKGAEMQMRIKDLKEIVLPHNKVAEEPKPQVYDALEF